jgi:hypothetical protein
MFFSQIWVASAYEVIRLLHDRDKNFGEHIQELYKSLTLVRVPLEKHEIASERKLTGPLLLVRYPPKDEVADFYSYSTDDAKRCVILPMACSERGSPMWCPPDIKTQKSVWIERRSLSEQFLTIGKLTKTDGSNR